MLRRKGAIPDSDQDQKVIASESMNTCVFVYLGADGRRRGLNEGVASRLRRMACKSGSDQDTKRKLER